MEIYRRSDMGFTLQKAENLYLDQGFSKFFRHKFILGRTESPPTHLISSAKQQVKGLSAAFELCLLRKVAHDFGHSTVSLLSRSSACFHSSLIRSPFSSICAVYSLHNFFVFNSDRPRHKNPEGLKSLSVLTSIILTVFLWSDIISRVLMGIITTFFNPE